jgi:hypothetical protein
LQTIGDQIQVSREGTKIQAKGENEKVQNSTKYVFVISPTLSLYPQKKRKKLWPPRAVQPCHWLLTIGYDHFWPELIMPF